MITYNNIIGRFEEFVNAHLMLRTFTHGSPSGVDLEKFEVYPALHVVYTGSTYENTSKEYSFEVYILDLPPDKAKKVENQTQLVSNAEQVAEDILADMMNGGKIFDFGHLYTVSNASTTPLEETTSNSLAGILLSISIEVGFTLDSCNAPLIGVTPSGSGFPAASPSGLLEVRTQDGNPTATNVTTIIVSNGTLVDNGLGVVTIDTDIPTNVYLPLTGGTLTGDLNVDADLTVTGEITTDSNFISSDSILVAATTGAGSILLRPNGKDSNSGQVILDAAGKVTTSGEAQIGGELNMSTNKITNLPAGTTNLDAVNYQQLTDAITGVLVYKGTWDADTNTPTLASGVGDVGSYYIVSVSGSTDLDGITDWVVGDWAVFSSTEWQKIDNTSILGGVGTGGKISKWTGSGVSRTLGDSIIAEIGTNIGIDTVTAPANLTLGDGTVSKVIRVYYSDGSYVDINGYGIVMSRGDSYIRPSSTGTQNMHFGTAANEWNNLAMQFENLFLIYSGGVERLRMDSTGRVGIGVSPTEKLHVEGNAIVNGTLDTSGNIEITGNSIGYIINEADSGNQRWQMFSASGIFAVRDITGSSYPLRVEPLAPTNSIYIKANGYVGIGTASPNFKLDVEGEGAKARIRNTTEDDNSDLFLIANGSLGRSNLYFGDTADNTTGWVRYDHDGDSMHLTTNNAEAMRINSSGNVGIGTTSPTEKLTVQSGGTNVAASFHSTDNQAWISVQDDDSGTYGALYGTDSDKGLDVAIAGKSADIRLGIDTSGNVGIGTNSPAAQLDVRTPDGNSSSLRIGRTDNANYWDFNHAGDDLRIYNAAASGSNILLGVDAAGNAEANNVGIGTASPASKLDVSGGDVEIQDIASGIIMKSPDGTRYRVTVANGGTLSVAAV